MKPKYLVTILVLPALTMLASPAHAGGIVSVCDETHLLAALAGGGTVTFGCSGTITLTDTIVVEADTTLDGSGQNVTISCDSSVRALYVDSEATLTLNNLTIANSVGGGIRNDGTLTVRNCSFTGNSIDRGGGIRNDGTLTVSHSSFSDNSASVRGGAIYNGDDGTLTVSNCTFSGNSAGAFGGGIGNFGRSANVSSSTFAGNSAGGGGGGIGNDDTLTLSNSTFFENSAGVYGGGVGNDGTLIVSNSTFSDNSAGALGGGLSNGSHMLTLRNTIVANSLAGGNCSGNIMDGSGNLTYPGATCPGINADPRLGILQNNGGPTHTMAFEPGSAALDAANDAICAAPPVNNRDQRGVTRPQGAHCDIGSYEAALQPITKVAFLPLIMR